MNKKKNVDCCLSSLQSVMFKRIETQTRSMNIQGQSRKDNKSVYPFKTIVFNDFKFFRKIKTLTNQKGCL